MADENFRFSSPRRVSAPKRRMIYTVKNMVVENPDLVYNDGVAKIILYINGTQGGSEELRNLLKYMSESCIENAVDTELERLQEITETLKCDRKAGERYMTWQEIIDYEKAEGRAEGRAEGILKGRAEVIAESISIIIKICKSQNMPDESIIDILVNEYSLSRDEALCKLDSFS